ncbi:MAG: hypothetical protein HY870_07500 [Chloroflexi bacterium]|nr:hypothetical protein [Chloroflexota bacterium]
MKQRHAWKINHINVVATLLIGLLLALSLVSAPESGDWREVIVGFVMLLAIGLGGLWFTQHQMKFR